MLIGITGGIGMGKTTVLREFASLGAPVTDADDVAHGLYEPGGAAYGAMVSRWGAGIVGADGRILRKEVGRIVFRDAPERHWLDGMLHPLIRSAISRAASAHVGVFFAAVPLLYESGWESDFQAVIAVWCRPETQLARLHARGWTDEECARRTASQLPADEKFRRAAYGIVTDCSLAHVQSQCTAVFRALHARV